MRIIICCGGSQTKWGNYLGVPSHLAPVGGVPLLHRTVRQALDHTDDVHITGPDDDRYRLPGVVHHIRTADQPSEYHSTRDLWSGSTRTVLLYGDVHFTPAAVETIVDYQPHRFRAFGRAGPSKVTGTRHGEFFAATWWPEDHDLLAEHMQRADAAKAAGSKRPYCWVLLRSIQGTNLGVHRCDPRWFTNIDDLTEDFDMPQDWLRHPAVPS